MLDFLSSFIDKISSFFDILVSLPSRFSFIFDLFTVPFLLFGEGFTDIIRAFLVAVLAFFIIYFIVKLVLDLL